MLSASELVRCFHGFDQEPWDGMPREITGLKAGIVGLGKSGGMIADALHFLVQRSAILLAVKRKMRKQKGIVFFHWMNC